MNVGTTNECWQKLLSILKVRNLTLSYKTERNERCVMNVRWINEEIRSGHKLFVISPLLLYYIAITDHDHTRIN